MSFTTGSNILPPGVRLAQSLSAGSEPITQIRWSTDGSLLVGGTAGYQNNVYAWSPLSGTRRALLRGHSRAVYSVEFLALDRLILVSVSQDETLRIWEGTSGKVLKVHSHLSYSGSAFSQSHRLLALCDGTSIAFWRSSTEESREAKLEATPLRLEGHFDRIRCLAWSPEETLLASGADDSTVRIWRPATNDCLQILRGHGDSVHGVAWTPDGERLVSCSKDATIRLWKASSGEQLHVLEGHTRAITSVGFSPDGQLLASKSLDGTVRIWRSDTWQTAAILDEPAAEHNEYAKLAWHPTDSLLATLGDNDQGVRVWDINHDVLTGTAIGAPIVHYVNAKAVLIGESGTGKSALAYRLAENRWQPTEGSTHGARYWQIPVPDALLRSQDLTGIQAELTLWDFAGQREYRLVHQLFLDDTDVALLLFDNRDETEPLRGIQYWVKTLEKQAPARLQKYLVASRTDVSPVAFDREEIQQILMKFGFLDFFSTSARTGEGIDLLRTEVLKRVSWDTLYRTTTTYLFDTIRNFLLEQKTKRTSDPLMGMEDVLEQVRAIYTFIPEIQKEIVKLAGIVHLSLTECPRSQFSTIEMDTAVHAKIPWHDLPYTHTPRISRLVSQLVNAFKQYNDKAMSVPEMRRHLLQLYQASSGEAGDKHGTESALKAVGQQIHAVLTGDGQKVEREVMHRQLVDLVSSLDLDLKSHEALVWAFDSILDKHDYRLVRRLSVVELESVLSPLLRARSAASSPIKKWGKEFVESVSRRATWMLRRETDVRNFVDVGISLALTQIPDAVYERLERSSVKRVVKQFENQYLSHIGKYLSGQAIYEMILKSCSQDLLDNTALRYAERAAKRLSELLSMANSYLREASTVVARMEAELISEAQNDKPAEAKIGEVLSRLAPAMVTFLAEWTAQNRALIETEAIRQELHRLYEEWEFEDIVGLLHTVMQASSIASPTDSELTKSVLERLPSRFTVVDRARLAQAVSLFVTQYRAADREHTAQAYLEKVISESYVTVAEVETVVGLLQSRGLVFRLEPEGSSAWVLLRPELANQYVASVLHEARDHPRSKGSILERDVLTGDFALTGVERLRWPAEKIMLQAMVELMIRHDLCFREMGQLIFPSQVNQLRPKSIEDRPRPSATYIFSGSIEAIYASLVIRMSYTEYFRREEQWRYAAEFSRGDSRFGLAMRQVEDSVGLLDIYLDEGANDVARIMFVGFITDHLKSKGIDIQEQIRISCPDCQREVTDQDAIRTRMKAGKVDISCQYCDCRILIPESVEKRYQGEPEYLRQHIAMDRTVKERRRREIREFQDDQSVYMQETDALVRLLHLSDIHLGTAEDARKYAMQLETDLRRELDVNRLEYLVLSGDPVDKSTPEEYQAAFELLDSIAKRFGLDPSRVVVVPGNHDLNWELSRQTYSFRHKTPNTQPPAEGSFIPAGEAGWLTRDDARYSQRFMHFGEHFYKRIYNGQTYPSDCAEQAVLSFRPDDCMLFLSLNSAWQVDHHYRDRSGIHMEALSRALNQLQDHRYDNWLKVAVFHHPVAGKQMMNNEFMELLAVNGFQVCMHGHIHEAVDSSFWHDDARGIRVIGAGTFGAPAKDQVTGVPLQYNLLVLDKVTRKIKVYTRHKEKPDGAWMADARWGDKGKDPKAWYEIVLKDWTFGDGGKL